MSDRKKAIETLKQLRLDYEEFYEEHNNEVTQAYDMAIASLETDEAYQLEYEKPKTGHWHEIPKYKDIAWRCSECEHFTTWKHKYCPNCGAKMVEPQESEET